MERNGEPEVILQSGVARGKFCCGLEVRVGRAGSIGREGQGLEGRAEYPPKEAGGLGPALSTEKLPPHDSKRNGRTFRPGHPLAISPEINP